MPGNLVMNSCLFEKILTNSEGYFYTGNNDGFSQQMLKKEDLKAQTQYLYNNGDNLDRFHRHDNKVNNVTKIFVGGLPADLTKDEFKSYFEKFGSIEDVVVMCDKETRRPRGFGFITFDSLETANSVLKNRFYELKNKRVEVKMAVAKERISRNLGSCYDTYNAMYNGSTLPYVAPASYGNFGVYYYGMNNFGYGAYNGVFGLPYVCYPYQNPNPSFNYANTSYYYADTYSYQRSYDYWKTLYSSKQSHKYRSRMPVVVKKTSNVKDGDDSDVTAKKNESLIQKLDHLRPRDSNDEESVVTDVLTNVNGDHAEISECLSSNYNREDDGGCVEAIEVLSFYDDGDGSRKQIGADGQFSSCKTDS